MKFDPTEETSPPMTMIMMRITMIDPRNKSTAFANDCPRLKDTLEKPRAWPAATPDDFHASILTCELAQTDRHDIGFLKLVPFGRFAPEQAH